MATSMFDTSMFDPFADFGGLGSSGFGRSSGGAANVATLRLDLYETQNEFKMKMDCPGVESEDLNIDCECKREEEEARNAKWHRWERAGNMTATRSLRFPDSADMSKVDAKLDNGVLCVCIGKRAESQPRRLAIKSRGGAQRIGVEAEAPPAERGAERLREAPRREAVAEPRHERAAAVPLVPVAVAEAALPRAYEPSREHERATGFAEREAELSGAPKVAEKLESAGHGMREGLQEPIERRQMREEPLHEEQRELGGGGGGYERGGIESRAGAVPAERGYEGRARAGEAATVKVSPPQALTEGRREEVYEARGAGAGTYGERAAATSAEREREVPRERIGGEHIGVRATRADEFSGREGYEGREAGREAGREGGVARVMYTTTRAEGGAKGHEAEGREGREVYGEEEHHRGLMGKVSDTMHRVGAKLRGEE